MSADPKPRRTAARPGEPARRTKAEQRAASLEQMPDAAEEDIFWSYHFVTGALTLSLARTGRIDRLSGGLCKSEDFEAIRLRMAKFMAGGFMAICESRAAERKAEEQDG